jgi:integrase
MGRRISPVTVNIDNDKGRIRLRWRYDSKRYSLNVQLRYRKANLSIAKRLACYIEQDLLKNKFDVSLLRYKAYLTNGTAIWTRMILCLMSALELRKP